MNKFQFDLKDSKVVEGEKIFRIISLKEFENPSTKTTIKVGQKGGYIAENALSQEDCAWVDEDSVVGQGCFVSQDGFVKNSALLKNVYVGNRGVVEASAIASDFKVAVFGSAKIINCKIYGNVDLSGKAKLENCFVANGNLSMTDSAVLKNCDIKPEKEGLSMCGQQKIVNKNIKGNGSVLFADSVKIKDKKKSLENKTSREK